MNEYSGVGKEDCSDRGDRCWKYSFERMIWENIIEHFLNARHVVIASARFVERPFFDLNTSMDEVCRTLALIPKKGSIRGAARGQSRQKRWMQRTPAMAKGLVDHIWSIKALMAFRAPLQ